MFVLLKSHLNVFLAFTLKYAWQEERFAWQAELSPPQYQQLKRIFLFPQYNNNDNKVK